jgi:hypothetical protein
MSGFNYNDWLKQTKSGPYQKTLLMESEDTMYKVLGKSKHHLIAYPDPQGGYTKSELTAWYEKGHDLGQTRQVEFATSKDNAEELAGQNIDEDTYTQTYDQGGPENPSPEDEQFQEISTTDTEDVNNAIEYAKNAEVHTFNNRSMPPEYSMEEVTADVSTDLANEIEELILKVYPKHYQDIRIGEYRPFKYDPDIPEFAEPVVLKFGYTGWEKLPDNLYSFLLSKFSVRERHGYDDDVQYIVYPKAGDRL